MWRKWLYRFQECVGLTERECKTLLILAGLLIAGSGARLLNDSNSPFDDAYYAELDAEFERLIARSDSFQASLTAPNLTGTETTTSRDDSVRMNLNLATFEELQQLPRIGPAMATRILSVREQLGRFAGVSDLLLVPGIGEKTFETLKPLVTVVHDSVSIH